MCNDAFLTNVLRYYDQMDDQEINLRGGPFTHKQIEYAFGIAEAVLKEFVKTSSMYKSKLLSLTFQILDNGLRNDSNLLNKIRGEIIKLGDKRLQTLLSTINELTTANETGGTPFPGGVPEEILLPIDKSIDQIIDIALRHGDIQTPKKGFFKLVGWMRAIK